MIVNIEILYTIWEQRIIKILLGGKIKLNHQIFNQIYVITSSISIKVTSIFNVKFRKSNVILTENSNRTPFIVKLEYVPLCVCVELRNYFTVLISLIFILWYKIILMNMQRNRFRIPLRQTKLGLQFHFPIDLVPNEIPLGAKSIGKVWLQSKLGLI